MCASLRYRMPLKANTQWVSRSVPQTLRCTPSRSSSPLFFACFSGSIFLILNMVILFLNITMTCRRMIRHPKKFLASFYDESEGIWFPAFPLALCTIILGTVAYGIPFCGPWLVEACYVAFWVYFVLAAAVGLVVQCTL